MGTDLSERRRTPRLPTLSGDELSFLVSNTVRLVDLSLTGAMLASSLGWPVGREAELRTLLNGESFAATVDVRRAVPEAGEHSQSGYARLGVAFTSLDESSRNCIRRFLNRHAGRASGDETGVISKKRVRGR